MWLKRVNGGQTENVEGVGATTLGKPFELPDEQGRKMLDDKTGRFAKLNKSEAAKVAKAKKADVEPEPATASGDGVAPAPAGDDAAPEAAPDHAGTAPADLEA